LIYHETGREIKLHCSFSIEQQVIFPAFIVRTFMGTYPGERTDLHDCISQLFAAHLRLRSPEVSVTIWNDPYSPVQIEGEVYARWLVVEQPFRATLPMEGESLQAIFHLMSAMHSHHVMLMNSNAVALDDAGIPFMAYDWKPSIPWAQQIGKVVGDTSRSRGIQFNRRKTPTWSYYRSSRKGTSLIWSPNFCAKMFEHIKAIAPNQEALIASPNGHIQHSRNGVSNFISSRINKRVVKILTTLDKAAQTNYLMVAVENYVIAFSPNYTLFQASDSSRRAFESERDELRSRHQRESEVLFPEPSFDWQSNIDDEDFERMARDLLEREAGVSRIRKTGHSRDRDASRDLLAEWTTSPLDEAESRQFQSLRIPRRVVIQCKAINGGVSKRDVLDIRDTIEAHAATGFMLITSGYLTGGLFDHMDKMRMDKRYFIEWWTRAEIEKRLNSYPDLVKKYTKVFRVKDEFNHPTPASTLRSRRKSG